ncbi:MAG: T9SS type B sorting domain-containing protein [Sphingobacteriales bacterium]|nr:MAG: T9SS type B sorting domain-containing protein [Sphingobacteriales bacterium]
MNPGFLFIFIDFRPLLLRMKKILFALILMMSFSYGFATHTKGGWMYYEYLGPGIQDPTKLRYRVGLNFYMDCPSSIIENTFFFSIFSGNRNEFLEDVAVSMNSPTDIQNCVLNTCYPCISNIPTICYKLINYETIIELVPNPGGYVISKQRCCRVNNITNIVAPSNIWGATYSITIPGVNQTVTNSHINSSPEFAFNDTTIVCADNLFTMDFSATDDDGDSLVYSFCSSYAGGTQADPVPFPSAAPPYTFVPYQLPFSGSSPLGMGVTLDPVTGIASGIAPPPGEYVITICVDEYRNGQRFAGSRKELHLQVAPCNPVKATLDPRFLTCGDLTISFFNQTDGPAIQNWKWIFGDPTTGANDTSFLQFPSHTFSYAGVYTIKLIVNEGLPCADSTIQRLSVYPGFFPGFESTGPYCTGQPVQFTDTTRTNYGVVDYWHWDFGDMATLADTSDLQNPTFIFTNPGSYTVRLISGNSLGCRDIKEQIINVLPSPLLNLLSQDTTYCALDSLQLTATGSGNFTWTPNSNILNANTATPTVFPTIKTKYFVALEMQGCISRDSVELTPLNDLTNSINALPATICEEDTLTLTGSSNKTSHLSWQWNPAASLATPALQTTLAFPLVSTPYTLVTRWGTHCVSTASVNIPVTPLAIPYAGPDSSFCVGQSAIPLLASGGNNYTWTPAAGLSNTNIPNPVASPLVTTTYVVAVGVNGCDKKRTDSILVTVRDKPIITTTNDTLICITDTLQLQVSGTGNAAWTPNFMISNTASASPLVSPDVPTQYHVRLTDMHGCFKDDSVFVDVKPQVTLFAGPDTSICETHTFRLGATGDALHYNWSPPTGLSDPNILNPIANPAVSTDYTLTGNIGKCVNSSVVKIKVVAPPPANAGPDFNICLGFDAQLSASGGSIYKWTPDFFLNQNNIANPTVIKPSRTTQYIVTVRDTLGCPLAITDTVVVTVVPLMNVDAGPRDTSIVEGEPLFLKGTGAKTYTWSPATWLSDVNIPDPVSNPLDTIRYILTGSDEFGCKGVDTIDVFFFRVEEDMYVPTAFTPNGDGLNDTFKPILLGMKSLAYFRVYNRLGELMFSTSQPDHGWDGVYKGKPQDTATFVWMAAGVTYKGQVKKKKGYVVLIR